MRRLHLHLSVADLSASTRFYSALFGRAPTKSKPGYAKWQLEDPSVNFAISEARDAAGLDHMGLQVDSIDELTEMVAGWRSQALAIKEPAASTCCYANSVKSWLKDPQELAWEAFVTESDSETYSDPTAAGRTKGSVCCAP